MHFRVTILGSGTSTGVPMIGCKCAVCKSGDQKNKRTRSSILITTPDQKNLLIDTSPDLRTQLLREDVSDIENVLFTHTHADHCHGFDDLRSIFFINHKEINCYLAKDFAVDLKNRFSYAFTDTGYYGTKPKLNILEIPDRGIFRVGDFEIETARVPHGHVHTSAFRIGSFLYLTDYKELPQELVDQWRGTIKTMVASAVRFRPHPTHSNIEETLKVFERLQVEKGFLTHISHEVDHQPAERSLPQGVELCFDGLKIEV